MSNTSQCFGFMARPPRTGASILCLMLPAPACQCFRSEKNNPGETSPVLRGYERLNQFTTPLRSHITEAAMTRWLVTTLGLAISLCEGAVASAEPPRILELRSQKVDG